MNADKQLPQEIAIVFSGGTDSTCAAALAAQKSTRVHLLTFYEFATRRTTPPVQNVNALQARFPDVEFRFHFLSVDPLVRHFSYDRYWSYFRRHGLLVLSTCGFSSLSWHLRTIVYCLEHGITEVMDGLTRELMHFPGHMDEVVALFRELYAHFGITYSNPVREWEVPEDRQFIDQVIVNTHGLDFIDEHERDLRKTTGRYLHDLGIMPAPNVKGSKFDRLMQQDCYPFVVYNIMCFWCHLAFEPGARYCQRMRALFEEKCADARRLLEEFRSRPAASRLAALIEDRPS